MYIEGTVSIKISDFDDLRKKADDLEKLENKVRGMMKCVRITKKHDDQKTTSDSDNGSYDMTHDITPDVLRGEIKDGSVGITISEKKLRKLIHDFIDFENSEIESELDRLTKEEFEEVPLVLEGSSSANCYFFTDNRR